MIKKYLIDILCIILIAAVAILAGRAGIPPVSVLPVIPKGVLSATPSEKAAIKEEMKKEGEEIVRYVVNDQALKDRNIFAADGKYAIATSGPGIKGPLPENPYTLIGILQGEEKKAVFREHTGSIVALTVGKEMMDGSVITRIDNISVRVEKGKEERELRIFNIKKPSPLTRKIP